MYDPPFSERVYRILERASEEAVRLDCEYVGTDHVLLALLLDASSPAARALIRLGVQPERVRREVESSVPPVRSPVRVGRPPRTPRLMQAVEHAVNESEKPGRSRCVEPEDLLAGLLREEEGLAVQVLRNLGLSLPDGRPALMLEICSALLAELGLPPPSSSSHITTVPAGPTPGKPGEENVQRAEEVNHFQGAPPPAASVSLDLPGVQRSIVHQGLLARLRGFLGWLMDVETPASGQGAALPPPEEPAVWGPGALDRFTVRARKVMQLANQEAHRFNHEYVGTEHILLGLVKEGAGVAAGVLKKLGVNLRILRQEIEKIVQPGPDVLTPGKLPPTVRARKVVEYAVEEAGLLHFDHIDTEHLLLGLLREEEGLAAQVLVNRGATLQRVRDEVRRLLKRPG